MRLGGSFSWPAMNAPSLSAELATNMSATMEINAARSAKPDTGDTEVGSVNRIQQMIEQAAAFLDMNCRRIINKCGWAMVVQGALELKETKKKKAWTIWKTSFTTSSMAMAKKAANISLRRCSMAEEA